MCNAPEKVPHARGFLEGVNLLMDIFGFIFSLYFSGCYGVKIETFDKGVRSSAIKKKCNIAFSVFMLLTLIICLDVYPRSTMWDDYGGMAYRGEICNRRSLGVDAVSK